jgi:hypothetical protein
LIPHPLTPTDLHYLSLSLTSTSYTSGGSGPSSSHTKILDWNQQQQPHSSCCYLVLSGELAVLTPLNEQRIRETRDMIARKER